MHEGLQILGSYRRKNTTAYLKVYANYVECKLMPRWAVVLA